MGEAISQCRAVGGQLEGVIMVGKVAGAAWSRAWDLAGPGGPLTHFMGSLTQHFRKSSHFPYFFIDALLQGLS